MNKFLRNIFAIGVVLPSMFFLTGCKEHTHSGGTATCTEKAVCECGEEYGEALGHTYGAIQYNWSLDNATCKASRTCTIDGCGHVDDEIANSQAQITQAQSVTLPELTKYTATFINELFETQIKENVQTEVAGIAKIGSTGYATIVEAINATESGDEIKLLGSITLAEGLEIASDKNLILDLNGYVISYASDLTTGNAAITNKGTLTIKDGSTAGTGKITYVSSVPSANVTYATNTILNGGTLTIANGTIENTTVGGASYAVDTAWYSNASAVAPTLTINGGKVVSSNIAVRLIGYATEKVNNFVVNGGTLQGIRTIWIQLTGSNSEQSPNVNVDINGGEFIATGYTSGSDTYQDAIYSYSFGNSYDGITIDISGGVFDGDIALGGGSAYGGTGYETLNISNGTFVAVYTYKSGANGISITGGLFESDPRFDYGDPTDFVANGYEVVNEDDKFRVVESND